MSKKTKRIKNTAQFPRGYMDGKKPVILAPGEEADAPFDAPLGVDGLVEVKAPAKAPAKAPEKKTEDKEAE